ncbi:unnamed protein product [Calicophoron daubneyi]|uniref:Heme-binding protein 1 n=1 Tax=Calicophoron daubneyi TaxID=300641 RepID=A0AAV2T1Z7_CALDB
MPNKETANYTVLRTWEEENVEMRQYPAQKWVSIQNAGKSIDQVSTSSFFKLFDYIQGKNVAKEKIPMTKPVCFTSSQDGEDARKRIITSSFYLPVAQQDNPPQPKNSEVFIEARPALKVYSRSYDGFSNDKTLIEQARLLSASLDKLGLHYQNDPYYFAGYNSPFKLTDRHNEVWFQAID